MAQSVQSFSAAFFEAIELEWIEAIWQDVRRALVACDERQRRRISRELHDQMGQDFASLIIGLTTLEARLPDSSEAGAELKRLARLARRLDDELHCVARELRPSTLDDFGLHDTLLNLAEEWGERTKIVVEFSARGIKDRRLPSDVETAVFRIVQEALTNVQKHAGASRVDLILRLGGGELVALIEDNGKGFDPEGAAEAAAAGRLGLRGMRERAELVGGTVEIEPIPGDGTTIFVRIPLGPATGEPTDA